MSSGNLEEQLSDLIRELEVEAAAASSLEALEAIRRDFMARSGRLAVLIDQAGIGSLPPDDRPAAGRAVKWAKSRAQEVLDESVSSFESASDVYADFDISLPGFDRSLGHVHPVALAKELIEDVLRGMGFLVMDGPEVVSDFLNFTSLNISEDHPARDMHDTFWLTNDMVLRTHTSSNQVPAMRTFGAPLRAAFVGRCFRYEDIDATHENTFDQVEGILIDRNVTIANLIAVMREMLEGALGRTIKARLRPGYFPFVEPGFELDIACGLCSGAGCKTCKGAGWIELLPCGMIHPAVLEHGGLDPDEYSGFAFGLGLTRLAMMRYGIEHVRVLNSGSLDVLDQSPVVP